MAYVIHHHHTRSNCLSKNCGIPQYLTAKKCRKWGYKHVSYHGKLDVSQFFGSHKPINNPYIFGLYPKKISPLRKFSSIIPFPTGSPCVADRHGRRIRRRIRTARGARGARGSLRQGGEEVQGMAPGCAWPMGTWDPGLPFPLPFQKSE